MVAKPSPLPAHLVLAVSSLKPETKNQKPAIFATMNTEEKSLPVFSPWLFWDSDVSKIDFHRDRNKIIRRAFDLGLIEDVVEALWYYKKEELVAALTTASYLPQNAILLASALFHLKPEDFKCHTSKQLHPLY